MGNIQEFSVKANCSHCASTITARSEDVGKLAECPKCGQDFQIEAARAGTLRLADDDSGAGAKKKLQPFSKFYHYLILLACILVGKQIADWSSSAQSTKRGAELRMAAIESDAKTPRFWSLKKSDGNYYSFQALPRHVEKVLAEVDCPKTLIEHSSYHERLLCGIGIPHGEADGNSFYSLDDIQRDYIATRFVLAKGFSDSPPARLAGSPGVGMPNNRFEDYRKRQSAGDKTRPATRKVQEFLDGYSRDKLNQSEADKSNRKGL